MIGGMKTKIEDLGGLKVDLRFSRHLRKTLEKKQMEEKRLKVTAGLWKWMQSSTYSVLECCLSDLKSVLSQIISLGKEQYLPIILHLRKRETSKMNHLLEDSNKHTLRTVLDVIYLSMVTNPMLSIRKLT